MRKLLFMLLACLAAWSVYAEPMGFVVCHNPEPTGCVVKSDYATYRRLSWLDYVKEETGIPNVRVTSIQRNCVGLVIYFTTQDDAE